MSRLVGLNRTATRASRLIIIMVSIERPNLHRGIVGTRNEKRAASVPCNRVHTARVSFQAAVELEAAHERVRAPEAAAKLHVRPVGTRTYERGEGRASLLNLADRRLLPRQFFSHGGAGVGAARRGHCKCGRRSLLLQRSAAWLNNRVLAVGQFLNFIFHLFVSPRSCRLYHPGRPLDSLHCVVQHRADHSLSDEDVSKHVDHKEQIVCGEEVHAVPAGK